MTKWIYIPAGNYNNDPTDLSTTDQWQDSKYNIAGATTTWNDCLANNYWPKKDSSSIAWPINNFYCPADSSFPIISSSGSEATGGSA